MKSLNIFTLAAAVLFICFSANNAYAQQPEVNHRSYIYCAVSFGAAKESIEENIGNSSYTREVKEWKTTIYVDYGQRNEGKPSPLAGSDGKTIFFNSRMAALNWLGMNGWELVATDDFIQNGTTNESKVYLRMDVTGLTYKEINDRLVIFTDPDLNDSCRSQQQDGMF